MKRIVACFLFSIMLLGVFFPVYPVASAAVYNPRLLLPDNARTTIKEYMVDSSPGWGNYNPYSAFNIGNCTWYAFGRAWEILGYFPNDLIFSGDAGVWFDKNKEKYDNGNGGYLYSTNRHAPALGAIAVWQDTSKPYGEGGHVAVVELISDNGDGTKTIVTSESAYASYYFRTITRSTEGTGLGWSGKWLFLGYIYIIGTDGIDPGSPYPGKPSLNNFTRSYSSGETTTFTWDSTGNTTHYNLYIDKRNADGSWEIDYKYWHYATSGLSYQFDDGIYRVLLQSTNANAPGWPYTNSDYITFAVGPHTHNKGKYMFYEAVHPHCDCYECSFCGEVWRDTSSSNEMDDCYYCQRPGKPTLTNFTTSYAVGQTIVFTWNSVPKATHYNLYIDKQQSDGTWEIDYRYWHYATSGSTTAFDEVGTYRVLLQATNSNFPGEDGTGWAYTNADYITFAITPATVMVTFDPNGGSVSPTSTTVTIGSVYGNLPTPTRTNYNFDGWYTAASGGNLVTASTTVTATTNHTLYAHWTLISYDVSVRLNGGSWPTDYSSPDGRYKPGSSISLATPIREGYVFAGWAISANGSGHILEPWGTPLHSDPFFTHSMSDIAVYNNKQNGTVTVTKVEKSSDCPTSSAYMLCITTAGAAKPGLGGFYQLTNSKSAGVFYHVILAKIPVGYKIERASNECGDGTQHVWLTSQQGTGEFETYIYKTTCGTTGTFSTLGHVYLSGPDASPDAPITWYVGYSEIFDGTGISSTGSSYTVGNGNGILVALWNPISFYRPDKPELLGMQDKYFENEDVEINWTIGANTTHCNYWLEKRDGDNWYIINRIDYAEGPITENLETGEYRIHVVATNARYHDQINRSWLWTSSDYYYFSVVHDYVSRITNPTCTEQGYTSHTCSLCGDSYKDAYTNALGHAWDEGVVTKPVTATEDGVKTYTCTRCGETKTEIIPKLDGKPNPFVDVAEGQYYYAPVLWAYYHTPRVTGGTDKTHFSPNQNCTREQIVTFIWKAYGGTAPKMVYNPFQDVKSDQYYYNAVLWAVENGITSGVGGGKFGVSQPCTREQVVTFLWTAAGKPEPAAASNPFRDVKAGQYYYKPVLWAVENGITKGMTADTFGVGKTCTRAQVVTFLYKAVGQGE